MLRPLRSAAAGHCPLRRLKLALLPIPQAGAAVQSNGVYLTRDAPHASMPSQRVR